MKEPLIIGFIALSLILVGCGKEDTAGGVVADVEIEGCKDSDGGVNKEVQGVVSVGDEDYSDDCVAGLLIEYYCGDGKAVNENIRCANKCNNGKCV